MKLPAYGKRLICLLSLAICSLLIFSVLVANIVNTNRQPFFSTKLVDDATSLKESQLKYQSNAQSKETARQV